MHTKSGEGFVRTFLPAALPPGPGAVSVGRRYVTACMAELGADAEGTEVATLLASEVVTNAVRHGSPPGEVRVHAGNDRVRVSVSDSTSAPPVMRDGDQNGGFGLHVLERGALDWGYYEQGTGKCVWFEIPLVTGAAPNDLH
ncbi:MAG TPA: ATP-binding protein [Actinocrinis sp.]|nr:ATP-binding protein [Actinocrinis sp.]